MVCVASSLSHAANAACVGVGVCVGGCVHAAVGGDRSDGGFCVAIVPVVVVCLMLLWVGYGVGACVGVGVCGLC